MLAVDNVKNPQHANEQSFAYLLKRRASARGAIGGNYSSQIEVDPSEEPKKMDPVWFGFSIIVRPIVGNAQPSN